jgi:hypothetical protein
VVSDGVLVKMGKIRDLGVGWTRKSAPPATLKFRLRRYKVGETGVVGLSLSKLRWLIRDVEVLDTARRDDPECKDRDRNTRGLGENDAASQAFLGEKPIWEVMSARMWNLPATW